MESQIWDSILSVPYLSCDFEGYHRFYWLLDTQFSVWEVRILSKEPPQKTNWSKQDLVCSSFEDRPIFEVRHFVKEDFNQHNIPRMGTNVDESESEITLFTQVNRSQSNRG